MKRIQYISRFSRTITNDEIEALGRSTASKNQALGVTGVLVCVGQMFFQVIEGDDPVITHLYHDVIVRDSRHRDIVCLKIETGLCDRLFPQWSMQVFNLNVGNAALPFVFRSMLDTLVESHQILAAYTQPSVRHTLASGHNPLDERPRQQEVSVLFCDLVAFSRWPRGCRRKTP